MQDADRLLVRGPVDPRDQRLGRGPDRPELDRVVARLVAVLARLLADLVAGVERRRRDRDRGLQRGLERRAAALQAALAAVDLAVAALDLGAHERAQVLADVAEPRALVGGAEMRTVAVRRVVDRGGALEPRERG